jgi:hypothetical protein
MNRAVIVDNETSEESLVCIKEALRACRMTWSVVPPAQAILCVETDMPSLVMIDVFADEKEEAVMNVDAGADM